ncbi:GNAT family N-acetyltransferase [Streptomyces sp. NPDC001834]|uniref:GNAT family N-acetyltransferase n=1 Tax=Streptomyces sp. NPDC001834 TaxID=3364616 RepID=UPI0036A59147
MWATPDEDPSPAFAEVGPVLGELTGDRQAGYESAEQAVAPYRPQEPAWFLNTVAVSPEAQGKGLGSEVLVPGIEEAGHAGYPAFLETSSERNVRFYERLGFRVTAAVTLPDGGPTHGACARTRAEVWNCCRQRGALGRATPPGIAVRVVAILARTGPEIRRILAAVFNPPARERRAQTPAEVQR